MGEFTKCIKEAIGIVKMKDSQCILDGLVEYKSGEAFLKYLQIGFSVYDLETMFFLEKRTIERRIIEYIKKLGPDEMQEAIRFIYEIKGFWYLDIIKSYISSSTNEKDFASKVRGSAFQKAKELYFEFGFIQNMIENKNSGCENKCFGMKPKKKNFYNRNVIKLS